MTAFIQYKSQPSWPLQACLIIYAHSYLSHVRNALNVLP